LTLLFGSFQEGAISAALAKGERGQEKTLAESLPQAHSAGVGVGMAGRTGGVSWPWPFAAVTSIRELKKSES